MVGVRDGSAAWGPHAANLFAWNGVTIRMDVGVVVEYVHVRAGSVGVREGERVKKGQKLCESGRAGFCPAPHLHIQCHRSAEADAPTVPFAFEVEGGEGEKGEKGENGEKRERGEGIVPVAGEWYSARGRHDCKGREGEKEGPT